jgi:hypothetical protein
MLAVATPSAGIAFAHGYSTPSGDAVGRPGLDNPAPGVRLAQALGDKIFNQSTAFNKAWDTSPFGVAFHETFGTPNYEEPTHGTNGTFKGILNSNGAITDMYNRAQAGGLGGLPDEEDLPGSLVRFVSGVPVTDGSHHAAPALKSSLIALSASRTKTTSKTNAASRSNTCAAATGKTSLRAHGHC